MSGFGNFAPLHNNGISNAGIPQPGNVQNAQNAQNAQSVQNGNAQGNPPREAPAVNDDATQAQALIRSLDILLTRAGKAAGQAVDDAALAKVVKGAKFNKATVNSLRATAKAANDAMRVLDSFTGGEFADAMTIDHKTGVVEWDKNSTVAKAVQNRILNAGFPQDPMMKFGGREPGRAEGRTLVADYKYMMAGNLYARDLENL